MQPADVNPLPSVHNPLDIPSKNASLQTIRSIIDDRNRIIPSIIAAHSDHRRENLVAVDLHIRRGVGHHRRLEHRPFPRAAMQNRRPRFLRLRDPSLGPFRIAQGNHRANISIGIARVANLQGLDLIDKQIRKFFKDAALNQQTLNRNAVLSGIGEAARRRLTRRQLQVGILMDNHPGIPAQFQRNLLLAGFALEHPADSRAASEADYRDARVSDHHFSSRPPSIQHTKGLRRIAGLKDNLGQNDR